MLSEGHIVVHYGSCEFIFEGKRKRQRDMGRFEAMQYFEGNKDKTLMWSALLFSDDKGPTEGGKADSTDDKCHHQKELTCEEM